MPAPELDYQVSGLKVSTVSGFDHIEVTFCADIDCVAFECRATREGADYGVGKGALVASFSTTPAGVIRTFEVYDDYLLNGDGKYRISLYAKSKDGGWNDNGYLIPFPGDGRFVTADGKDFLCMR